MFKKGYTYDDVALVPQYNNVASRTEPELDTWITRNTKVKMPLIPANMESVIGLDLAKIIVANGGLPILHRFTTVEQQIIWINELKGQCFLSVGYGKLEDLSKIMYGLDRYQPIGVTVDIAHGHSLAMLETVKHIKNTFLNLDVIAGNVCTSQGYIDLVNAGADAVKVGVGPGARCTTRMRTGFGVPQFTAVYDCAQVAKKFKVPVIADGAISGSREVALALAAGASTVMVGKLFACTEQSAAEKRTTYITWPKNTSIREAKYRGQASAEFQKDYYGGMKAGTVAEGTQEWAPVTGSAQALIDELLGGLRSALTYGGARSIKELQSKAEFMEVTGSYKVESGTRK